MSERKSMLEQRILEKAQVAADQLCAKQKEQDAAALEKVRLQGEQSLSEGLAQAQVRGGMIRKEYEASAHLQAKLLLLKKKDELVERVIAQAWEQLKVALRRDDYQDVVQRLVQEAVQALGLKEAVVALGAQEKKALGADPAAKLGSGVHWTLSAETLNSLGGVKVMDKATHLLYDNTWEARLERARAQLAVVISDILFSAEAAKDPARLSVG